MSYQILGSNKTNKKLEVEIKIDEKLWKSEFKKSLDDAAKKVSLPGFRKGKVPPQKALEFVNQALVLEKTANKVLSSIFDKVMDEKIIADDEDVINTTPDVELKKIDDNTAEFVLKFDLIPEVKIADYRAIPNVKKAKAITEDDIKRQINALMKNDAEVITKEDETVENGNIAIIDFKGTVDGKQLDSACADDYELEIGSNSFIAGFEEGLIGLKVGKSKTLELSFPADYHATELQGKPVKFDVTIKSVKTIKYPELNDEYVKSIKTKLDDKVNTVADLRAFIKERLEQSMKQNLRTENLIAIRKYLVDNSTFDYVPEKLIKEQANKIKNQYMQQIERYKLSLKDALAVQGTTEEKFEADINKEAENNVKYSIMLEKIATSEKIECTDKEIEEKLKELFGMSKASDDKEQAEKIQMLKAQYADHLEIAIIGDKVLDFIVSANEK